MPLIELITHINAPIDQVFNLARSIDLHSISTASTRERAIAGKTSGVIELNETVTWQAYHFGIKQTLESKITALEFPTYFRDEMLKGAFKAIYHEHLFEPKEKATLMIDKFQYEVPYGIIGKLFDQIVLHSYMKKFLNNRNKIIKEYAESFLGTQILNHK